MVSISHVLSWSTCFPLFWAQFLINFAQLTDVSWKLGGMYIIQVEGGLDHWDDTDAQRTDKNGSPWEFAESWWELWISIGLGGSSQADLGFKGADFNWHLSIGRQYLLSFYSVPDADIWTLCCVTSFYTVNKYFSRGQFSPPNKSVKYYRTIISPIL